MRAILKQTTWLFLAQGLTRIISLFYTFYLAKNLGVDGFGLFAVSLAYFSLFASFADFGFNRYLSLEVSKSREKVSELIYSISLLRLTFVTVLFAIFALFLYILDPDKTRVNLSLLAIMAVIPLSLAQTFDGVFVAIKRLEFSATSQIVVSFSTAVFGIYFITGGFGPTGAAVALILGQGVYLLSQLFFLSREKISVISHIDKKILMQVIIRSLPFGVLAILGIIYFKIDTLMLTYMRGNFEAGIYSAGYRFLEALVFIPNALNLALFPAFVKLHEQNSTQIKRLVIKSTGLMLIIGIIFMIGYALVLPVIIKSFLPSFLLSIEVIKILALAIPFMFVHVAISAVLLSTDRYLKQVIAISFIPLTFNIFANLLLIPTYGFIGAAWITVVSDVISTIVILTCIKKIILK